MEEIEQPKYSLVSLPKVCEEWAYSIEAGEEHCPCCLELPNKASCRSLDDTLTILTGIYPEAERYLTQTEAVALKQTPEWYREETT